jgi:lipopolysaccharide export system ATP-binding protein
MFIGQGLSKSHKYKKIVNDFSIELNTNEIVGLLGPNGAGKTTAFYMMAGIVTPDHGKIYLDGHDITELPMYARVRRGVGYLPQESSIFRDMTVRDNILCAIEQNEKDSRIRERKLDMILQEFSILHLKKSIANALSGGERRRLEMARCIASNPRYVMLDEPFAGVDPIAISDIKILITKLKKQNIGVLITDHNVKDAIGIMDRVYIMYEGSILISGTAKEVVSNTKVKKLYLGEKFIYDSFC